MEFRQRRGRNIIKPVRISIRPAYRDEWDDAMALAWRTFMQYEACDFTPEGVESFQDFYHGHGVVQDVCAGFVSAFWRI